MERISHCEIVDNHKLAVLSSQYLVATDGFDPKIEGTLAKVFLIRKFPSDLRPARKGNEPKPQEFREQAIGTSSRYAYPGKVRATGGKTLGIPLRGPRRRTRLMFRHASAIRPAGTSKLSFLSPSTHPDHAYGDASLGSLGFSASGHKTYPQRSAKWLRSNR